MAAPSPSAVHFLGIGAQKAATTWLYEQLASHPEIGFPAGKELQFWNHRDGRPPEAWLVPFAAARPGLLQGEITPGYALLDDASVAALRALCPGLRVFFCMRNPMERAWSSALMALERAELALDEASDAWFADHFRSRGSLGRGDYETVLRRWRGHFGDESVLAVFHDEIRCRPASVLGRVARHIGVVDGAFFERQDPARLSRRVFAGSGVPVRASLRPLLRELYAARVDSLARYLGRDLTAWLDFDDEAGA
ncbi:MAG: sulfotransferase family protein [Myxococcota bacterium]